MTNLTNANKSVKLKEGVLDEIDDDGFMAKRQLYDLAKYSIQLHKMIQDSDNLEPWVQAKITKAADYIDTVKHYMEYQVVRDAEATAIDIGAPDMDAEVELSNLEVAPMAQAEAEVMEYENELPGFTGDDLFDRAVSRGLVTYDQQDNMELRGIFDDTANFYFDDADEIGSSDISIALKTVCRDAKAAGIQCQGKNAHLYESSKRGTPEEIMARMFAPLKGRK